MWRLGLIPSIVYVVAFLCSIVLLKAYKTHTDIEFAHLVQPEAAVSRSQLELVTYGEANGQSNADQVLDELCCFVNEAWVSRAQRRAAPLQAHIQLRYLH